jgi:hypothetical protein
MPLLQFVWNKLAVAVLFKVRFREFGLVNSNLIQIIDLISAVRSDKVGVGKEGTKDGTAPHEDRSSVG